MSDASEEQIVLRWLNAENPRIVHVEDRDYYRSAYERLREAVEQVLSPIARNGSANFNLELSKRLTALRAALRSVEDER